VTRLRSVPRSPWQRRPVARGIKRAVDVIGATAVLAAASPVMAVCAIAVRRQLGSPVLFRQRRPGLDGKPFDLLKFRTMKPAPTGQSDAAAVKTDVERLTPLGKRLREWSLDELPTLLNVLRGEMSLVGPRPLLMEYLGRYSPEQQRRHDMPPGMTGWAQVNGRNSRPWDEKLAFDTCYVDRWSLWLDAQILLRTVGKVLRRDGIYVPGAPTTPEFMGTAGDVRPPVVRHG